jgi:hypothetical protein
MGPDDIVPNTQEGPVAAGVDPLHQNETTTRVEMVAGVTQVLGKENETEDVEMEEPKHDDTLISHEEPAGTSSHAQLSQRINADIDLTDKRSSGTTNLSGLPTTRNVSFAVAAASTTNSHQLRQGNMPGQHKTPPANPYLKEEESGTAHIQRSVNPARVDKVVICR